MTPEQMEKLTPTEIKALVYDEMANIEQSQQNIRVLQAILIKKNNASIAEAVKVVESIKSEALSNNSNGRKAVSKNRAGLTKG